MKATIEIDDELLEKARQMSGLDERGALLNAALTALIEREAGDRLARAGGSRPTLKLPPRRRSAGA